MWRRRRVVRSLLLLAALGVVVVAACDSSRDRPTGLGAPLPETTVTVLQPESDDIVPAESVATVVIEARGLVKAVELLVVRNALPDTLARQRREFDEPVEAVQAEFEVSIPALASGVHLEIRGVAEDVLGRRHFSERVFVTVIECDVFPLACGGP